MLPLNDPGYHQFVSAATYQKKINLSCNIEIKNHLEDIISDNIYVQIATFPKSTWMFYRSKSDCLIIPKPHILAPFTSLDKWLLRFNNDFTTATIYCSKNSMVTKNGNKRFLKNIFNRPLDQLFIMHYFLKNHGALLHAAGAIINDESYLFPGISGTGKSTLAKLCQANGLGSWLSDERVILKRNQNDLAIYGTPWYSATKTVLNKGAPLKAMFFIKHGTDPTIRKLAPPEIITKIFATVSIPWHDNEFCNIALNLLDYLIHEIPAFEFSYRPESQAIHALEKFINEHVN